MQDTLDHHAGRTVGLVLGAHRIEGEWEERRDLRGCCANVLRELGIALLGHRAAADGAGRYRLLDLAELGLHQCVCLVGDLAASRGQHGEDGGVLGVVVVAGATGNRHWRQPEMPGHAFVHRQARRSERCQCAGRAAQHGNEDAWFGAAQPLYMSAEFVDPGTDLVTERRRYGVLTVGAPGAGIVGMPLRNRCEQRQYLTDLTEDDLVGGEKLDDVAGLGDVLGCRPPVHVAADLVAEDAVELPDQRDQRMRRDGQSRLDVVDVEQLEAATVGDFDRGVGGNHVQFRFGARERGFDVEPGLPASFASEQGADPGIGNPGGGRSVLHGRLL